MRTSSLIAAVVVGLFLMLMAKSTPAETFIATIVMYLACEWNRRYNP